jgi:hypothetical protein
MAVAATIRRFRTPLGQRIFAVVAAIILVSVTGLFVAIAALSFVVRDRTTAWTLGLIGCGGGAIMGALSAYVLRDLAGKLGLRVVFDDSAVALDLPAGRSLIHRPPAQHITIPLAAIGAIEARYEAYRSLGMISMQRAYMLSLKNGQRIFLFEERAQATTLASSLFATIADEIAARSGIAVRELGMVEGKGGFLAAFGTRAADWAALPLPRERAEALWRRTAATGRLAVSGASVAPGSTPGTLMAPRQTPRYPEGIYPGRASSGGGAA